MDSDNEQSTDNKKSDSETSESSEEEASNFKQKRTGALNKNTKLSSKKKKSKFRLPTHNAKPERQARASRRIIEESEDDSYVGNAKSFYDLPLLGIPDDQIVTLPKRKRIKTHEFVPVIPDKKQPAKKP